MYEPYYREESSTQQRQREEHSYKRLSSKNTCEVRLMVHHPSCAPSYITDLLELTPDNTLSKEQTVYKSDKYHVKSPECIWTYEWFDRTTDCPALYRLQRLLDDLFGKLPAIRKLQSEGARLSIQVNFDIWAHDWIEISPEYLAKLAQIKAKILVRIMHHDANEPHPNDIEDEDFSEDGND
ncbi:MAG TPA: hypothetical protein V6C76_02760 [Drouetiella sp.]